MLSQENHFTKRFTKTVSALPVELFVELKKKNSFTSEVKPCQTGKCVVDLTCISCLTRDKDYFAKRLREERSVMVKQAKEYWDSQAMLSMGI